MLLVVGHVNVTDVRRDDITVTRDVGGEARPASGVTRSSVDLLRDVDRRRHGVVGRRFRNGKPAGCEDVVGATVRTLPRVRFSANDDSGNWKPHGQGES